MLKEVKMLTVSCMKEGVFLVTNVRCVQNLSLRVHQ